MSYATETLTTTQVTGADRLSFTVELFGPRRCIQGENAVYNWMGRLCRSYEGGYWHYVRVSSGAGYMALDSNEMLHLEWAMNYSEETVSADAAGIVVTLFALTQVMEVEPNDAIIERFYQLRDFAAQHSEARAIFRLID